MVTPHDYSTTERILFHQTSVIVPKILHRRILLLSPPPAAMIDPKGSFQEAMKPDGTTNTSKTFVWVTVKSRELRCTFVARMTSTAACTNYCENSTEAPIPKFNGRSKTCDWAKNKKCRKAPKRQYCGRFHLRLLTCLLKPTKMLFSSAHPLRSFTLMFCPECIYVHFRVAAGPLTDEPIPG